MGATVTVGKKVAAFKTPSGKTGYVLFENTYEKNCHPHSPHWSCVGIGYLEDVLARIFACGSSCEGGGLQGRGGYITPEGYIAGWLTELAMPTEMLEFKSKLAFGENFYATIPESLRDRVLVGLREEGLDHVATALCGEGYEASLHDDIEVLRAIYVKHRNELGPWRFIGRFSVDMLTYNRVREDLGYQPVKDKGFTPQIPQMVEVYNERMAVRQTDGTYRVPGPSYWITSQYIQDFTATELAHPGTYRKAFKVFREAVKAAPKAAGDTEIVVTMKGLADDQKYRRELVQRVATCLGKTTTEFTTTLDEDNHLMYNLTGLESLVWLPKLTPEASIQFTESKQESLFGEMVMA
jgi:hypothetical protein